MQPTGRPRGGLRRFVWWIATEENPAPVSHVVRQAPGTKLSMTERLESHAVVASPDRPYRSGGGFISALRPPPARQAAILDHFMPPNRSLHPFRRRSTWITGALALAAALSLCHTAHAQFSRSDNPLAQQADLPSQGGNQDEGDDTGNGSYGTGNGTPGSSGQLDSLSGPRQLRQTPLRLTPQRRMAEQPLPQPLPPYVPSEFERYVNQQVNTAPDEQIRRLGAALVTDSVRAPSSLDPLPSIPGSYVIRPGDEIQVTIWGSVNADLRLEVDRSGAISIPRVGLVTIGGIQAQSLAQTIRRRVSQLFQDFQLDASVADVRPIRVFVGGFARRPGSLTVNGLSSILHVVMRAGGPTAAGSFRDIRLVRDGKQVAAFDLYDLLLKGDHALDQMVQPDDIVFIGPVGAEVAVVGSVNQQALFELKPGETLEDALRMAGGFTSIAERDHVSVERVADRLTGHVVDLQLPAHAHDALDAGDLVWAYSATASLLPKQHQNERIHVDGEVAHPGDYLLPPGSTTADAIRVAGGMTSAAYPYGLEFTRRSVRIKQQANYDKALRELESEIAKDQATQRVTSAEENVARTASNEANARLLQELRQLRPNGRVVLEIDPDATAVPTLPLEDGDTLRIPSRDTSVGVFGSVFNAGSFIFRPGRTAAEYLHLAGGPTRGADKASMFLIRADGEVLSAQQGSSFWHSGNEFTTAVIYPGDAIFVPEELNKTTFVQDAKDWTQILYQFGLGLAGIKALGL
jgi:protein involved in polysaccharide export with SLBB domain